jgi:hypothetical protein
MEKRQKCHNYCYMLPPHATSLTTFYKMHPKASRYPKLSNITLVIDAYPVNI